MNLDQLFQSNSNFLKAQDIHSPFLAKITGVRVATFKNDEGRDDNKVILALDNIEQEIRLAYTNTQNLMSAWGSESEEWKGRDVEVYTEHTNLGPGVRVRPHQQLQHGMQDRGAPF